MSFVHLHVHTEYSLVDGLIGVKQLISGVADQGGPAVAVTDQHNLFAAVKMFTHATQNKIKPIIGADLRIVHPDGVGSSRIVLLCQDAAGYLNLSKLLSRAYQEGQIRQVPMLQLSWLNGHTDGLICLTGGPEGVFTESLSRPEALKTAITHFKALFGDRLYLEISRVGRDNEEMINERTCQAAVKFNVPVVATNDVRFLNKEDYEAHEAKVCINRGEVIDSPNRSRDYTPEQYLKTPEEMKALFADVPQAVENTLHIARRCNAMIDLGNHYLPDFPVPDGMTDGSFLAEESRKGLEVRMKELYPDPAERDKQMPVYAARLQTEIDVINGMGFPGYFLIVADFIQWAKNNAVPVGPGRGSGAGSLVAFSLKITDLDPLAYDLLFERFLNPERVSLPDFDVDFCMEGRDRVIDYVARKYGRDHVSQIITFGTMAAKAVLRDTGRVLGHPYGMIDSLAKLIPFDLKMTLDKALEMEPKLAQRYRDDTEVRILFDLARKLEGKVRNVGKHAGGVVIAPKSLPNYTPVYCEDNGSTLVSQFDKDDVENAGLVKFDFLGLKTLTIIDYALKKIKAHTGEDVDITAIPMDDRKAYELMCRADTTAVFQLESRGMKELIKKLQPDTFEEVIALVALFRPGPLQSGMVDDFVNRKHGKAEISYPHPDLEPVLKPTYGVIVYQEQVMQIAQVLAGYTLGGADMLRRAMGKKKAEEMAKQRKLFVDGATDRGVDALQAGGIFDLMEKFAEYGFNKSHSAAYALIAYQTAWLKAHYPAAFMAAVMSADMDNTDKVVGLIAECHDMGLQVLPPSVNDSGVDFTVVDKDKIRYGLGAVKGVGENILKSMIAERQKHGSYRDLFDFAKRTAPFKVTSRVLQALIESGACDQLPGHRASKVASIQEALKYGKQTAKTQDAGQFDLFGGDETAPSIKLQNAKRFDKITELNQEKAVLGLYVSGHPIHTVRRELDKFIPYRIADLPPPKADEYDRNGKPALTAGLVVERRDINTRNGGKMAVITLDDGTGRIEVVIFDSVLKEHDDQVKVDSIVVIQGDHGNDKFSGGTNIIADTVMSMTDARMKYLKGMLITSRGDARLSDSQMQDLKRTLSPYKNGPIKLALKQGDGVTEFDDAWRIIPSEAMIDSVFELPFINEVRYIYDENKINLNKNKESKLTP